MTFRLFIDEVGNADLRGAANDDNVRYLSLTGILTTDECHKHRITPAFQELKDILKRGDDSAEPVILHRREIVRRDGIFARLRDPEISQEFDRKLLVAIDNLPYRAMTVQIDKREHLEKYQMWHFDPYHYCLNCLVERFVLYLRRHRSEGLVIIEPRSKFADKKLKNSFAHIFKFGTEHVSADSVQQALISKDIHFYPKKSDVAGLQLADMIAHPSARYMRFEKAGMEAPSDMGSQITEILLRHRYLRNPTNGVINGWGTKWLP